MLRNLWATWRATRSLEELELSINIMEVYVTDSESNIIWILVSVTVTHKALSAEVRVIELSDLHKH